MHRMWCVPLTVEKRNALFQNIKKWKWIKFNVKSYKGLWPACYLPHLGLMGDYNIKMFISLP